MDLTQLLVNAASHDARQRDPATQQLKMCEEKNVAHYLLGLCAALMNEQVPVAVRQLGGIQIKNAISAKSEAQRQRVSLRWMTNVPDDVKNNIKQMLLQTLGSHEKSIRSVAAVAIAKIAAIEVPEGKWPDIVPVLHHNITSAQSPEGLKQSSFEALGIICEECPEPLQDKSSMILTAIASGMGDGVNNEIKFSATKALANCLDFVKSNFALQNDRNTIMQMVFKASQCPDERVRVAAYQCLVEIGSSYYKYLPEYMQTIFKLTAHAIQNESEDVSLQAMEFWSTICDEEILLLEEEQDAQEKQQEPENKCHRFMENALPHFAPMVLLCLAKQSEDVDDDTWNPAMAAGTCLDLMAQCTGDAVVDFVLPFVQSNIQSPNWRLKEAAILGFGSILDGPSPDKLRPLVQSAFLIILNHLKDPSALVKDTAAWTIGRICNLLPETINEKVLDPLMNALVVTLKDVPKVAANICWAIHNLATAMELGDGATTSPLSRYFEGLIRNLLQTTDRPDVYESNLLTSAWEAINLLIHTAAPDTYPLIGQLVPALIGKLRTTLTQQGLTGEDREKQNEIQGLLCGSLQVIIQKLDDTVVKPHADDLMRLFLQVLHSKTATVHEEALLAISAIATRVGEDFEKYMEAFKPFLMLGLQNSAEHHVCKDAVGVVSEISAALKKKMTVICDDLMRVLLHNLQNPLMERSVKPHIISCLADVALAVEGYFERYLPFVMMMLVQASQVKFDTLDYDNHEYLNQLREAILEAYTGILQGLAGDHKEGLFVQFAEPVVLFLDTVAQDQDKEEGVTRAAVGVIGDLASTLGPQLKPHLQRPSVATLIQAALVGEDPATQTSAQWTQEQLQALR